MTIKIHIHRRYESAKTSMWIFSRMTPHKSCRWNSLEAVENWQDAEYIVVVDDCGNQSFPKEKLIYLGSHPPGTQYYCDYHNLHCAAYLDIADGLGFNEWWIDYTYDELMDLKPPTKTKKCVSIVSDSGGQAYHNIRKNFIRLFCSRGVSKTDFELYGKLPKDRYNREYHKGRLGDCTIDTWNGNDGYRFGKEPIYLASRYAIELDAGPFKNYISERFFDSLLLWCMPIYWGGTNVEDFFPANSFRYFNAQLEGDDVLDVINSDFREQNIEAMAEARDLVLNKYQLWPTVEKIIDEIRS